MSEVAASVTRDQSPPLMMLGIIHAVLFKAGLLARRCLAASEYVRGQDTSPRN